MFSGLTATERAQGSRDLLTESGLDRAYVAVANLIRLLVDKGFLAAVNEERPFVYQAVRPFDDVSRSRVGDLVQRLFNGSRKQLLVQILGGQKQDQSTLRPGSKNAAQKLVASRTLASKSHPPEQTLPSHGDGKVTSGTVFLRVRSGVGGDRWIFKRRMSESGAVPGFSSRAWPLF